MFENVREKLSGYKVYIISVAGIMGAIAGWVSGALTQEKAIEIIWESLLAMTARAAIKKVEPAIKE